MITVSIISHNHNEFLPKLINHLATFSSITKIIVTDNVAGETKSLINFANDKVFIIYNEHPKGFGANHNHAFQLCRTEFFCVLNPDVEFFADPFPILMSTLTDEYSIVSPLVLNTNGQIDDHARRFPTLASLILKLIGLNSGVNTNLSLNEDFSPDWLAGMFMIFKSDCYRAIKGFDERYFLYYEDVDICFRFLEIGKKTRVCTQTYIVHKARRDSHRKLSFLLLHLKSIILYFAMHPTQICKF